MLSKIQDSSIKEVFNTYGINDSIKIYTRILSNQGDGGKTALFIHGGGSGGNHTIVTRPSYWMIQKGLFSRVILPDRRGAGLSSPLTKIMTYEDNAKDMKALLDAMGITEKLTVIGISYGGPIALTLAGIDSRIEEVILIASSPSLKAVKGLWGFMYRHNMLEPIVRKIYKRYIGKLDSSYPDFDDVYDLKNQSQLKKFFLEKIKHIEKDRFESLMLENASTCNLENQRIKKDFKIDVPVYRVIGTKDETWEMELGDEYKDQIPNMKTRYIQGAGHKDVFFKAAEFYDTLYSMLKQE